MVGSIPSHNNAAQFVNKATPRQPIPAQPKPTRNVQNVITSNPVNKSSPPTSKQKATLQIEQKTLRNAPIKNDVRPTDVSKSNVRPKCGNENTEAIFDIDGSSPSDSEECCEIPNTKGRNIHEKEAPIQKWTFQLTKFPAPNPKNLPQNLLFVAELNTNVIFLIDSGAEISILPKELTNGVNKYFPPQSRTIQGFGNKSIHPIGSVNVELRLGELDPINHSFWVTEETRSFGIIGLDMLMANQLAIFPSSSKLCKVGSDKTAKLFAAADLPTPVVASVNKIELVSEENLSLEEKCKGLLKDFPEITRKPTYYTRPKHNHELKIDLDNYKTVLVKARRAGGRRTAIEDHFNDLLDRGVVVRGEGSQGASPVTCVQKKDGSLRICADYTRLNKATRPLCYPLPRIDELALIIPGGTKYFTNLDLKEAYYSLPLSPDSRQCAAIIVHSGVFIPNRCIFGLKSAPMRFQMLMECLLRECKDFTYVYLDDILVYSYTEQEHIYHVRKVLETLSKSGLFLNVKKTTFGKSKLEFLGHIIGTDGIDVQAAKVAAIREYPIPVKI